jgi:TIR domain
MDRPAAGMARGMADIFVSYTSSDRDWAFWIAQELEALGHVPHIHEWEISGGGDIAAWMEERHDKADHILCVISETYLNKPYSSWERRAAQWATEKKQRSPLQTVFPELGRPLLPPRTVHSAATRMSEGAREVVSTGRSLEFDTRMLLNFRFDESLGQVLQKVKVEASRHLRALFRLCPNFGVAD